MIPPGLELRELRTFLILADELHFGRTGERLGVSPSYVSQTIRTLETRIGGSLFERTSRRVRLTGAGEQLQASLAPLYEQLGQVLGEVTRATAGVSGTLRIAFAATTEGPALTRLVEAFSKRYPDCTVVLVEVSVADPYRTLRSGEADVLFNWLAVDEPGLLTSAPIEHQARMLAVSSNDPLALQQSVSVEELRGRLVPAFLGIPDAVYEAFYPPPVLLDAVKRARAAGPDSPLRVHSMGEAWALVARGLAVHATAASLAGKLAREDITLVPIPDLPPLPIGLVWMRTHENARIRALVEVAEALALEQHLDDRTAG